MSKRERPHAREQETEGEKAKETKKHHPMLQSSMARETGSDMFSFSFCVRAHAHAQRVYVGFVRVM